jgi:mono/diheme cytochrome c family protein
VALAAAAAVALFACGEAPAAPAPFVGGGDPAAGAAVIRDLGCGTCHAIPGIRGARGIVGPPLAGFARRPLIAGELPNRPDLLVRWVRDAPSLVPATGMPALPLSERQAVDVASYLYTLR